MCELEESGKARTFTFELEKSGYVHWNSNNGDTDSMPSQYFYDDADYYRILIVDPFVDENGTRLEYAETPNPTQHNTICYSDKFYIN